MGYSWKILLSFIISCATQYIIICLAHKFNLFIDKVDDKPQLFHRHHVPRAGGIGIFIGSFILLTSCPHSANKIGIGVLLIIASLPSFLIGKLEDIRNNLSVKIRLPLLIISPVLGMLLLGNIVKDIGIFTLPMVIAIPFTLFAVIGMTNAINIIDGFNGLASGISLIAFGFLGLAAYIVGDIELLKIIGILFASLFGFFVWNFPRGKVFLGDGGAYFLGFMLASISILLVNRNPQISPWFVLVILAYPVWEVIFSAYRKKMVRKKSPLVSDRVHLHMLIYQRITKTHWKTSVYLWMPSVFIGSLGIAFSRSALILSILLLIYVLFYNFSYNRIVRFKVKKLRKIQKVKK